MSALDGDLLERLDRFFRDYYREPVLELARDYPRDAQSLTVSWEDIYTFDDDLARDYLIEPSQSNEYLVEALQQFDNPVNCSFQHEQYPDAAVRVADLDENHIHGIGELRSEHATHYIGVTGQIAKVADTRTRLVVASFECQVCGVYTDIPQPFTQFQEPHKCSGCECQGPFEIDFRASETVDHTVLRLQQPPEDTHAGQGEELTVYVEGDLIEQGGENGVIDRAGERVTIYGILEYDQSDLRAKNPQPIIGTHLNAEAIEFEESLFEDIDTSEHKDEFTELAARDDVHQLLAESIAPELYADTKLNDILLASVFYLFGGYRKSPSGGATYRGDIHMLLIGDPGTSKSTILSNLEKLSPRSEFVSGTAVTGVGLTAAAVRDDFAGDTWSLEPGVLPRANGGHAIVDEIDKAGGDAAEKMHDALEGDQQIRVSKGGMRARLSTRTGLLASGNPDEGRFNRYDTIPEQIDLDPALLSRFDLIFTLQDTVDDKRDREVSSHILGAWQETADAERDTGHTENSEKSVTDRPISRDCIRAWVTYARREIQPRLPDGAAKDRLQEFYLDTRNANENGGDDAPIPITPRALEAGLRLSEASARVRLADEITEADAERAIAITKHAIGDANHDPESGTIDADRTETGKPKSQRKRRKTLSALLQEMERDTDHEKGVPTEEFLDAAESEGIERSRAKNDLETFRQQGDVYEPAKNHIRWSPS